MTDEEFNSYYQKYKGVIASIARKLSGRDTELYKDLKQEGAFALFKLNPAKAHINEDAWIRQAVKFRMIDYLRKTDPENYDSLQDFVDNGAQLTEDPEDGEVKLVLPSPNNHRRAPRMAGLWEDTATRIVKMQEEYTEKEET